MHNTLLIKNLKTMLLKLLEAVRFLGRQGQPLRGHSEDVESFEGSFYSYSQRIVQNETMVAAKGVYFSCNHK